MVAVNKTMKPEKLRIRLFSLTFHRSVFLPLLFRKFKLQKDEDGPSLGGVPFEYTILAFLFIGGMVAGFMNSRTIIGLIAGIGCFLGFFALLVAGIRSQIQSDQRPTWENFRLTPFLFLILSGISVGLVLTEGSAGTGMKIVGVTLGMGMGYLLGIPAGLWIQSLGWMSAIIEVALWPVMVGLAVVSLLMAFW